MHIHSNTDIKIVTEANPKARACALSAMQEF
jgi:hypothetical protein